MDIFKVIFNKEKGRVVIDGRDFDARSVGITDEGVVYVDGKKVNGNLIGAVSITVNGDVKSLETFSGDVTVAGSTGSVSTQSGDVECGDVIGNVSTMSGDVTCGGIGGNVSTMSGDVYAGR